MKKFKKIYIEITNVCNLKCTFCPDTKRKKEFMEVESFKKIISKIKNYTNLITLHIKGEPLLHPKFDEIVKNSEIPINVTTNGTLLLQNKEALSNKMIRQINISLHSLDKNLGMNTKDYIEKIFEAIDYICEKNSNIYISYRLWNLKTINENSQNYEILKVLESKYKVENIIEKARENMFIKLDENIFLNQDIEFEWPSLDATSEENIGTCYGARQQLGILVNGDVVPCCLDQDGVIKLGNIFEQNLDEILESERAKNMVKGFCENRVVEELCKKCRYRKRFDK